MPDNNLIRIRKLLEPVFAKNAVIRALIFGSYARGDESTGSDIDFLVEFAEGASILNLGCLIEDIKDTIDLPADVLTFHSLKKEPREFSENVLRDAKVIYEVS